MKLNWGKSIVLAMILFIGFIMFMVVTMLTDKGFDHEMVVEEYYKKEQTLNQKIESQDNGETVIDFIDFKANTKGILVSVTSELNDITDVNLTGYRASDKSKDFTSSLKFSPQNEALVQRELISGLWEFSVSFSKDRF
jgi:hypothetical protein